MKKIDVVKYILRHGSPDYRTKNKGIAWASSNVALCKYWGKRDEELNLPMTSSLSVSLGKLGACTRVSENHGGERYLVNGKVVAQESIFARRLKEFLDLYRRDGIYYTVETNVNIPIAAGFASSACGFAALTMALDQLYNWGLDKKELSILARLGSGSACRSIADGFVEWHRGIHCDGMDSYAEKLDYSWPELSIGLLTVSREEKPLPSRDAMKLAVNTSPLYARWPEQVTLDLAYIKTAMSTKDFTLLGEVAENNAIAMHELMKSSVPTIDYSTQGTLRAIASMGELRASGVPIYFTQDAGPNVQFLFLAPWKQYILNCFPTIEIIAPFGDAELRPLVLVDGNDGMLGVGDKMTTHIRGDLHRAFSVVILRGNEATEILLQRRSSNKYHSANLWSNACCGHPSPGEDVVSAGERRLVEEMGFQVPLRRIGQFHYRSEFSDVKLIENEIDHLLIGFSGEDYFTYNPLEVQEYRWVNLEYLLRDLGEHPEKYTVWLPQVLNNLLQWGW